MSDQPAGQGLLTPEWLAVADCLRESFKFPEHLVMASTYLMMGTWPSAEAALAGVKFTLAEMELTSGGKVPQQSPDTVGRH